MNIRQSVLRLMTNAPIKVPGQALRGYIASLYPACPIVHNHDGKRYLYIYPRIQYRVSKGDAYIIGIEEGDEIVREIYMKVERLELNGATHSVLKRQIETGSVHFGLTDSPVTYRFAMPWLALNEENYRTFRQMKSLNAKTEFLKKVLIGNLLSMSKSLGYVVDREIQVDHISVGDCDAYLKGNAMLGFLGDFSVNFEIPDFWGIGKSVSRGFGTIKSIRKPPHGTSPIPA